MLSCTDHCTSDSSANGTAMVCSSVSLGGFLSGLPSNTVSLSIEFTNQSTISLEDLKGVPTLEALHLSGNKIRALPSGFLKDLLLLHTLNLLQDLPSEVFCG
ncbi:UNVERIFIED_CONTAM: hypothetical protein FKN15_060637 [Acipenser sinensis]